jgi:hypothetical protein
VLKWKKFTILKLDAAVLISLAKGVIENSNYTNWTLDEPEADQIHINAKKLELFLEHIR